MPLIFSFRGLCKNLENTLKEKGKSEVHQIVEMTGRRVKVNRALSIIPRQEQNQSWLLDECQDRLDAGDKNDCAGIGLVGAWSESDIHAVFFLDRENDESACRFVQECDMSPTNDQITMVQEVCKSI